MVRNVCDMDDATMTTTERATPVETVGAVYAAFGRGDIATIINGLAPDVDWDVNGRRKDYPLLGSWKGPGAGLGG